jgi:hypothetical protein
MVQSDGGIASIDGGVVVTSMDDAIGTRIAFDDAGRIVVAGVTGDQAFVARLLPDGTFDSSFAGTGRATYFIGGSNDAFGLAIQRDGRIVVGTRGGDAQPTVIARFWP